MRADPAAHAVAGVFMKQATMDATPREFIDFWIENSIHAAAHDGTVGATQDVDELVRRCIDMAQGQGITEAALQAEVGDIAAYIRKTLKTVNKTEQDRE
jgi:hypothetical protein